MSSLQSSVTEGANVPLDTVIRDEAVVKAGWLNKKRKRAGSWKRRWFVLRPEKLAYYKDTREYQTIRIIDTDEISAVAVINVNRPNVIGIYTNNRAFYLQADSLVDVEEWVESLRRCCPKIQTHTEADAVLPQVPPSLNVSMLSTSISAFSPSSAESESIMSSPDTPSMYSSFPISHLNDDHSHHPHLSAPAPLPSAAARDNAQAATSWSSSVASDDAMSSSNPAAAAFPTIPPHFHTDESNRVLMDGYLQRLHGTPKTWRKRWVVLRPTHLAFYKTEKEYQPTNIVRIDNVIETMQVDTSSRSRRYTFQVITLQKSYLFCADTEALRSEWLQFIQGAIQQHKRDFNVSS